VTLERAPITRKWSPRSVKGIDPGDCVYGIWSYFAMSVPRPPGADVLWGGVSKASNLKYLLTKREPVKLQLLRPG
jgi:hypothetical protein